MSSILAVLTPLEILVGAVLSLMIFSLIIKDNVFSRLAQYILVGTATGYLGVIAIQDILRPQLFTPLAQNPFADLALFVPLFLGLALLVIGTIRIFQVKTRDSNTSESFERGVLYNIGTIPVVLLLGIGLAAAVIGTIQGTLLPQFWRAAQMGLTWNGSVGTFLSGIITLLVTIGVFLHLYAVPAQQASVEQPKSNLPKRIQMTQLQPVQDIDEVNILEQIISFWAGLGKRMLWLTAGVLFARLIASRLSLLIAQFEYIANTLKMIQPGQLFMSLIQ